MSASFSAPATGPAAGPFEFTVHDAPITGLDRALGEGLTEQMQEVHPELSWGRKALHIPVYAEDARDGPSAGKELLAVDANGHPLPAPADRDSSNADQPQPQRRLLAGLTGYTVMGLLYVSLLWVDPSARGRGLGAALMRAAEAEARARGCRTAFVDTLEFQAPGFYEHKLGYKVLHVVENCWGKGIKRTYFRKEL